MILSKVGGCKPNLTAPYLIYKICVIFDNRVLADAELKKVSVFPQEKMIVYVNMLFESVCIFGYESLNFWIGCYSKGEGALFQSVVFSLKGDIKKALIFSIN